MEAQSIIFVFLDGGKIELMTPLTVPEAEVAMTKANSDGRFRVQLIDENRQTAVASFNQPMSFIIAAVPKIHSARGKIVS